MKNIIESIKAKLKNISLSLKLNYNFILQLYFQERFLYRLSISQYKNKFILKGGLLIFVTKKDLFRMTKDIDLLGKNISNDLFTIKNIFKNIIKLPINDGINFDEKSISAEIIKEGADYEGVRIKLKGLLGKIKQQIIIDIGFGDKITPKPYNFEYPVLLNNEKLSILAYNKETIIAEKIEAICKLGISTSRMKDFYDIIFLFENCNIDPDILKKAIINTFKNRSTDKSLFLYLQKDELWSNQEKMWKAFIYKIDKTDKTTFKDIKNKIVKMLNPFFENKDK